MYFPTTPGEIAYAIRDAEADGVQIRAVGSGYSLSAAAIPSPGGRVINSGSFAHTLQYRLARLLNDPNAIDDFFFVEAGVTIADLTVMLDHQDPRRALPTQGGSSAQTLAGAFSTGTHGTDVDRAPLADAVRAIYLIGQHGVHWWIEPEHDAITDAEAILREFPCIEHDHIIRNDATFEAALVSVGCMGVIYAVILDVVPQSFIYEVSTHYTWSSFVAAAGGPGLPALLNDALTPPFSSLHRQGEPQAAGIRGIQLTINPMPVQDGDNTLAAGEHFCVVTVRKDGVLDNLPIPARPNLSGLSADAATQAIEADPHFVNPLAAGNLVLYELLHPARPGEPADEVAAALVQEAMNERRPWMVEAAIRGIFKNTYPNNLEYYDVAHKIMDSGLYKGRFKVVSLEAAFPLGRVVQFVDSLLALLDGMVTGESGAARSIVGRPELSRPSYGITYPAGWVSVRFTPPTRALIGMQRYSPLSAMVEVSLLSDPLPELAFRDIEDLVMADQGILHWGQANGRIDRQYIETALGPSPRNPSLTRLEEFNQALAVTIPNFPNTFASRFAIRCGLVTLT